MARRKNHKWVWIGVMPLSVKDARRSVDPEGPDVPITPEKLSAAWIQCEACETKCTAESLASFCTGDRVMAVPT